MNFEYTEKVKSLMVRLEAFMQAYIYPVEKEVYEWNVNPDNLWKPWPGLEAIKEDAKAAGLWNLFLPEEYGEIGAGLTNLEYAPLAEIMGRVIWAPEIFNCSAPDTGNMEVLAKYGSAEQQERWLKPLLKGDIRSAFLMTEPKVASSDATNIETSIVQDGDEYVVNGLKWWISGIMDPRCKILIVFGKSTPDASRHSQHAMILVPRDTPGVKVNRTLTALSSHNSPGGEGEVMLENVRLPKENIILGEGRGFEIAQGRLGPGRIHHCMRQIGAAQRSLELMCHHTDDRIAFGKTLSMQGSIRQDVARSRCDIDQARFLTLAAADKMDQEGNKAAKELIAMIKIVAPQMCQTVTDRAMQSHGAMGLSQDTPIAQFFAAARYLRFADGPDEVHMAQLGKLTIASLKGKNGS